MSDELRNYLDLAKVTSGYGKTTSALLNILRGHNHRGAGNIVPANTDEQGFTFFTKPNLNLSYDNVNAARRLSFLSEGDNRTLASAIRCSLSPDVQDARYENDKTLSKTLDVSDKNGGEILPRSAIVDDAYPFIPLLSNTLLSLSGWEDFTVDTYTSKEGMRREVTAWVDSPGDMFGQFDLTATFQNVDGDPVTAMFAVWMEYAARVAEGSLMPYANCILENEIDYMTRIYRFVMDPTRTFIRKIADVGVAFPTGVPNGSTFNYTSDQFRVTDNNEISIRFNCLGARYNDPITVRNFNNVVKMFNSQMRDGVRDGTMVKLNPEDRKLFNYRGYPLISVTNELEWYVPKGEYTALISSISQYPDVSFNNLPGKINNIPDTGVVA